MAKHLMPIYLDEIDQIHSKLLHRFALEVMADID